MDAAARGLLLPEKPKRTKAAPVKVRGVYFKARPAGEALGPTGERGEWWASDDDGDGGRHREKCGTRSQAVAVYQRRKSEVRQGRLFPENMRKVQAVTLAAVCKSYLAALAANGRDPRGQVKTRLAEVQAIMGDVPAASIRPQDIEALKAKLAEAEARGRGRARRAGERQPVCARHPSGLHWPGGMGWWTRTPWPTFGCCGRITRESGR